jgi:hypothetical protein
MKPMNKLVDDALAKVQELGTVGAMQWLAAQGEPSELSDAEIDAYVLDNIGADWQLSYRNGYDIEMSPNFLRSLLRTVPRSTVPDAAPEALQPVQRQIVVEILTALDRLGAKSGLVAPIASWGDTLTQDAVLVMLKEWNALPVDAAPDQDKRDAARLDFITEVESVWTVQWQQPEKMPARYRMIGNGEPWGEWYSTAREAIDAAMQSGEKP